VPLLSFLVAGSGAGSLLVLLVTAGLVPVATGLVSSGWLVSMSSVSVSGRSLASSKCDVLNAITDGARKAYARGPRSERHSSRELSGGRSYRSRLVYFTRLVDLEYSA
jgi:hypothetical protein